MSHLRAHGGAGAYQCLCCAWDGGWGGGLSTWLLELTLQVTWTLQDVYSANMSPSHWLSLPRITMQFFSRISGVFGTLHNLHGLCLSDTTLELLRFLQRLRLLA